MATMVLQAAGGMIGSLFGPVGTAIGSAIGAMGGYMIDNALINSTRRIEGPRLSGTRPMQAEEGAALPAIYGTMRVGGTLIWATRFEEEKITTRQGSKGGPKTTTYSYYANAAFAVSQGEISGIRRIWADGKELDQTQVTIRVCKGTEEQQPDPLIEARQGAGKAPAYRGTAYVVLERLPVDAYGNRLPLLQFEVMRSVGRLARDIRAVALIPGATEFGLSPQAIRDEPQPGETRALNRNNLRAQSDWSASLDELQALCPNLKTVALVVPWFGTDLRAGECRIVPGVTAVQARNPSREWRVGTVGRMDAHLISDNNFEKAYGGTPSDFSVIDAIRDAKQRGLQVTLYPFIMMDIPANNTLPALDGNGFQPPYPWRGRIALPLDQDKTPEADIQLSRFISGTWGYKRFIRHYLELAGSAGGVDAFLIGSELRGLTHSRNAQNGFPFVNCLCDLATEARNLLGTQCKITYGADWSEYFGYHPQDGSGDVFFHLDPLWAHPAVSSVGIDNYMPLSDWRDGDERSIDPALPVSAYDEVALQSAIAGGEGYDWYYASAEDRQQRKRSDITDGLAGKPWVYRYKDLCSWWQNRHYNRVGGVELTEPTAWQPMSKPFWLTELGCAAVDKGSNQPNVFPDPKSSENASPYFSDGSRCDIAQDRFLRAHFSYWRKTGSHNPVSPVYGAQMLDPEQIYVWAWDTRPFPEYPLKADIWGDAANWATGHWLNGRLSGVALDELFEALFKDFDLAGLADCRGVEGYLSGYIADSPVSGRALLEPLMDVFGVAAFEQVTEREATQQRLVFRSLSQRQNPILLSETVQEKAEDQPVLTLEDAEELPASAELYFSDALRDYQSGSALAQKSGWQRAGHESLSLPAAMENGQARGLAESWLERKRAERRTVSFSLPWSQVHLTVGDRVRLPQVTGTRDYTIVSLEDGVARRVKAVALAPVLRRPDRTRMPELPRSDGSNVAGPPVFHLLDLPMWPGVENQNNQFRIACYAKPWREVALYSSPEDSDYQLRTMVPHAAVMGELATGLKAAASGRLMHQQSFDVRLYHGELQTQTLRQVLNAANTALVQNAQGSWEILQFLQAEEVSAGHWRLKTLLRGQCGTEESARFEKQTGAAFVLLDDRVVPAGLQESDAELLLNWRAGSAGQEFSDAYFSTQSSVGGVRALQPLSPVHLRYQRQNNAEIVFEWVRRGRIDADNWMGEDIPLGEATEKYQIQLWNDETLLLKSEVMQPRFIYTGQVSSGDLLRIEVAQVSQAYGAGAAATLSFRY
ncbi:glycoside hydrolase TIM-barrel-like domain-containing protein [Pseudochrobactrum sp. sp1633]|uniref:baseplate multidomain protein megatron n=1 Tax=Pseudochrobactrum sp. sp1633 TaxID=3036706 RepID=UPI0025A5A47A|nr:glycoside hydrolase TIM-barrel-like domain-containing protein [Pseudochrobactrum sp. sp1633]MDM8345164.1 glycoside hydrolase TIM-barrel-like domain-containing protein [Pseudochrobactrum sp. sp1633]HWD12985.1 glycoside hydrolase TIM-barrel-like domain-containing protein [Pseudochrobactrum sp.]